MTKQYKVVEVSAEPGADVLIENGRIVAVINSFTRRGELMMRVLLEHD